MYDKLETGLKCYEISWYKLAFFNMGKSNAFLVFTDMVLDTKW